MEFKLSIIHVEIISYPTSAPQLKLFKSDNNPATTLPGSATDLFESPALKTVLDDLHLSNTPFDLRIRLKPFLTGGSPVSSGGDQPVMDFALLFSLEEEVGPLVNFLKSQLENKGILRSVSLEIQDDAQGLAQDLVSKESISSLVDKLSKDLKRINTPLPPIQLMLATKNKPVNDELLSHIAPLNHNLLNLVSPQLSLASPGQQPNVQHPQEAQRDKLQQRVLRYQNKTKHQAALQTVLVVDTGVEVNIDVEQQKAVVASTDLTTDFQFDFSLYQKRKSSKISISELVEELSKIGHQFAEQGKMTPDAWHTYVTNHMLTIYDGRCDIYTLLPFNGRTLDFESVPLVGAGNQNGAFYFTPWRTSIEPFKLDAHNEFYGYYPRVQDCIIESVYYQHFMPVCNIVEQGIYEDRLEDYNPVSKKHTAICSYPRENRQTIVAGIYKLLVGFDRATSLLHPQQFETAYLLHPEARITAFLDRLKSPIANDLVIVYFSKFKQLEYFVSHLDATQKALEQLEQLSHTEQQLFIKFMGNIGFSRPPLHKLVADYYYFLGQIAQLNLKAEDLFNKTWLVPPGGNDPAVMMDVILYLLVNAKSERSNALHHQLDGLNGLEISGLHTMPCFIRMAAYVNPDIFFPKSKNKQLSLIPKKLKSGLQYFHEDYRGIRGTRDIEEFVSIRDLFVGLTTASYHSLTPDYLRALIKQSKDPNRDFPLFRELVFLTHGLINPMTLEQAQTILSMLRAANPLVKKAFFKELFNKKLNNFQCNDIEQLVTYFESFILFHKEEWPEIACTGYLTAWEYLYNEGIYLAYKRVKGKAFNLNQTQDLPNKLALIRALIDKRVNIGDVSYLICLCTDLDTINTKEKRDNFISNIMKLYSTPISLTRGSYPNIYENIRKHKREYLAAELLNWDAKVTCAEDLKLTGRVLEIPQVAMHTEAHLVQVINQLKGKYRLAEEITLDEILEHRDINDVEKLELKQAYYRFQVFQDVPDNLKDTLVHIYMAEPGVLKTADELNKLINLSKKCDLLVYTEKEHESIKELMIQLGGDALISLFVLLNKYKKNKVLPFLLKLLSVNAAETLKRLEYFSELAEKTPPLYRLECLWKKIAETELPLEEFTEAKKWLKYQASRSSILDLIVSHPRIKLHVPSHLILCRALVISGGSAFKYFVGTKRFEKLGFFEQLVEQIPKNVDPRALNCFFVSLNQDTRMDDDVIIKRLNSFLTECSVHGRKRELFDLYQSTTPSLDRLFDGVKDPDGLRMQPHMKRETYPAHDVLNNNRVINFTRKFGKSEHKIPLRTELNRLILQEDCMGLYDGKGPSQMMPEEITLWIQKIKDSSLLPIDKARLALPLIEEALFYATQKRLYDTQRLAILNLLLSDSRVCLININTGEGKTLIDMVNCALLFMMAPAGDKIEFTTSALTDAQDTLDRFKGFFKVLGIAVAPNALSAQSEKEEYTENHIIFSTLEELGLFDLQYTVSSQLKSSIHCVVNEVDSALFDRPAPVRFAVKDPVLSRNLWIYDCINELIDAPEFELTHLVNDLESGQIQIKLTNKLQAYSSEDIGKKQTALCLLTNDQWVELFLAAHTARELKYQIHYILNTDQITGKVHVHPMINDRAAPDPSTQFGHGVQQFLCSRINLGKVLIQGKSCTVHLPEQTLTQAETNVPCLLLNRYKKGGKIWGSSGTVLGTERENNWLLSYFGADLSVIRLPAHKESRAVRHQVELLDDAALRHQRVIELVRSFSSLRPTLIFVKDIEEANLLADKFKFESQDDYQIYTADTRIEASFVQKAGKRKPKGMISFVTQALSRNTDFAQSKGINVVCTVALSERAKLQALGRGGRNGNQADLYEVYDKSQTPHKHEAINNEFYGFLTELSLSGAWKSLRDDESLGLQKRACDFMERIHEEWDEHWSEPQRFIEFLKSHSPFPVEQQQQNSWYLDRVNNLEAKLNAKEVSKPLALENPFEGMMLQLLSWLRAWLMNTSATELLKNQNNTLLSENKLLECLLDTTTAMQLEYRYLVSCLGFGADITTKCLASSLEHFFTQNSLDELLHLTRNPRFVDLLTLKVTPDNALKISLKNAVQNRIRAEIAGGKMPPKALLEMIKALQKNVFKDKEDTLFDKNLFTEAFKRYNSSWWYIEGRRKHAMQGITEALENKPASEWYKLVAGHCEEVMAQDVTEQSKRVFRSLHRMGSSRFLNEMAPLLPILKAVSGEDQAIILEQKTPVKPGFFNRFTKVTDKYNAVVNEVNLNL